jgi:hypothetical protein
VIDRFQRNNNYFEGKLAKDDKTIYPQDFDSQFNDISKYLDDILKPAVDSLTNEAVKGVAGNRGAYLHNVGDGTTDWKQLNSDKIDNYSITFDKLVKHNIGSVLITKANGDVDAVSPLTANQVLVSRGNNTPIWQKITSENIEDKTLTGDKFSVLAMENFVEDQFITNIVPNIIDTVNIKDENITNEKIQNGILTSDQLGIFLNLPVVTNGLTINHIADNAITGSKAKDATIPISKPASSHDMDIWKEWGRSKAFDSTPSYRQIIRSANILESSIEDKDFAVIKDNLVNLNNKDNTDAAKAFFKDVPLGFQFTSRHLALDKIDYKLFDNEVQAAINRLKS